MILGVALVVNELNKGQRMIFRYPESIPTSIANGSDKGLIKLYNQYFGFSLENLAKLFRPKNALLSKVLEISIDDLCFISYPCQCHGLTYDEANGSGSANNEAGSSGSYANGSLNPLGSPIGLHSSQSGGSEVITMFNVIVTSVSSKAMRKINPEFVFKCQYKFASTPGADPIASALGLRAQSYGICRETIRRLVETVAASLLQQERSCRYVTEQVTLMLRIMDNWSLSKQLDASSSGGGPAVMESGLGAALSLNLDSSGFDLVTPNLSRVNSNRPGHAPVSNGVDNMPGVTTIVSADGSLKSTPRTSRSNSNAPPLESVTTVPAVTPSPATAARTPGIGGGAGVAVESGVTYAAGADTSVTVTTGIGGAPRVSRANGTGHATPGTNSSSDAQDSRLHDGGIAQTLSIDTEFTEASADSNSTSARLPGPLLNSSSSGGASAYSSVFPSLEVPTGSIGSPGSSITVTPVTATNTPQPQRTLPPTATAAATGNVTVAAAAADLSGKVSPTVHGAYTPASSSSHIAADTSGPHAHVHAHGLGSAGSASNAGSMYASSFTGAGAGGAGAGAGSSVNPGTPLTHSRASSGLGNTNLGGSSRASSGLSTTPSKAQSALLGAGGSFNVSSAENAAASTTKDKRSTEWGPHLMTDFIALSHLANELRVLFHNIIGGHSVNVSFNGVKSVNVPLFCNDRRLCEDCVYLKSMNCMASGIEALGLQHPSPSAGPSMASSNVTISLSGAGGGRSRQPSSPYVRPQSQGQLSSVLNNFNNTPHSARKNSKDSAKMKGFNLNTQTMLTIADTDTIMNILQSLDSCNFNMVGNLSESSLHAFGGEGDSSSGDLQSLKHLQQLRHSSRLVAILEAADPTQSFLDLSLALDEPVEELLTTASYVRSWGLAEVIPVIYSRSCYRVHSKAVLNRDSRVGRAFEALLLSFDVNNERSPTRSETIERLNSENFLPGADIINEHTPKDTSPPTKRRSSSMTSNDGSHDSLRNYSMSHGYNGQTAGTTPTNGAQQAPSASAHYLVSPEVSKYRQRRETRENIRDDPQHSLRNSRSSEHFFKNVLTTSQSLTGGSGSGDQTSPPQQPVAASRGTRDITPTRSHSLSVSATSSSSANVRHGNSAAITASTALGDSTSSQVRGRERVNSLSATDSRDRQAAAQPAFAFGAFVSAIFGQAATHANQVRKQRGSTSATATPSMHDAGASFRDVDGHGPSRGDASNRDRDSRTGEVVQNQLASSYPPSALGTLNISSANREHGFQPVISLAEVGGLSAPLTATPLLGPAALDDTTYNVVGRPGYPGEEAPLFDEQAPPLVHCLDVADNIPPQYSLPALLAAFNGARTLQEVLELWPEPLREFSVEIVVFLLRWHEIVPVDSYIVNLLHLTDPRNATSELSCATMSASNAATGAGGAKQKALLTPAATRSSSKVNFALGTALGESAYSTSPTAYSTHGLSRGGYSESKTSLSPLEEAILPLRENLPRSLSMQEVAIVEKIFPFIVNTSMSSKTLGEIVWMVRVAEEELVQVIEKVPYLQIVKKLSV